MKNKMLLQTTNPNMAKTGVNAEVVVIHLQCKKAAREGCFNFLNRSVLRAI